jgi:hypothetical protein
MLGGVLFPIGVALHPLRHGEAVNASPYSAIHVLIAAGLFLCLFGLVGLFVRQPGRVDRLSVAGFILAFIGNLWTYGLIITEGFMWPAVAIYDPSAVHNFAPQVAPRGRSLLTIFFVGLAIFAIGYVLFGTAMMRSSTMPGWLDF